MINSYENLPKISCLMVTGKNRFDYFVKSFQCYQDQTYPNRELIIVNEGPKSYQEKIANHVAHRSDVRLVFLDGWYSLGALRNISIALSFGDIFVQWDDDDFNAPERLAVQYNFLSTQPKAKICFLSDQLHYYFNFKTLFLEDWYEYGSGGMKPYALIPGTGMAWRKSFHNRYPSAGKWCSAGEDSVLSSKLCEIDEQVSLLRGYGYMQMYSYHGDNVWNENHHMGISRYRSLGIDKILKQKNRICKTLDYLKLSEKIKVMGREGLAFIYEVKK
jgi:glycosyltransferase involved in cell wall biosynthesis